MRMIRWTRFGQMGAEGSGEEAAVELHGKPVMLIRIERRISPTPYFHLVVRAGIAYPGASEWYGTVHESAHDTMREAKQAGKARTLELLDHMAKFVRGELYGPGRVK
jgi:hypothetical protein